MGKRWQPRPLSDEEAGAYERLLAVSPQATMFCQPWWLEAVAPGRHQILFVDRGGEFQAAWPIVVNRVGPFGTTVVMPPLTPSLGILLRPTTEKQATRLGRDKRLIEELVSQLPPALSVRANFHRNFVWWSPLYWNQFKQTTRYSYVLSDLSAEDNLWNGLGSNIRREIRKARNRNVEIRSTDLSSFWEVLQMTYARQDMSCPHDFAVLERIDGACASRDRRKILAAVGEDGTLHAVAYLVWDEQAAYYLAGGGDPEKRTSGAASLLMWEAIKFASTVSRTFDFEGSMLEPVDRFFRGFGAEPTPYSCIQKQSQVVSLMRQSKDGLTRLKERIAGR